MSFSTDFNNDFDVDVPVQSDLSASVAEPALSLKDGVPTFLGNGLFRPFRRDQKADFAAGTGLDLVKAAVGQILGTKADSAAGPGEIPWRTDFGSRIHLLRHKNIDAVTDLATVMIQEALSKWEPRLRVVRVTVVRSDDQRERRQLILRVRFNVVDSGGRTVLANQDVAVPVNLPATA